MTATVSISQDDVFTALRTFILGVISCEVVQGLGNGVPPPKDPFIALTALYWKRLSTNIKTYDDPTPTTGAQFFESHVMYVIQVDCYGPKSSDWATIICTLLRDEYAVDVMAPNVTPLHADDAKQLPVVDGEKNFEQRWMIEVSLQYNPVVQIPAQFFDTAQVDLINVDVAYPPT